MRAPAAAARRARVPDRRAGSAHTRGRRRLLLRDQPLDNAAAPAASEAEAESLLGGARRPRSKTARAAASGPGPGLAGPRAGSRTQSRKRP